MHIFYFFSENLISCQFSVFLEQNQQNFKHRLKSNIFPLCIFT